MGLFRKLKWPIFLNKWKFYDSFIYFFTGEKVFKTSGSALLPMKVSPKNNDAQNMDALNLCYGPLEHVLVFRHEKLQLMSETLVNPQWNIVKLECNMKSLWDLDETY